MEGRASPMVPSGSFSGPEHQLEGSDSNSTGKSSSRGDHGYGAQGTARGPKKRKVRSKWSNEQTQQLLDACLELKSRCRMRAPPRKWQSISIEVNGKTADECRRRMETLTKSFYRIKNHLAVHLKQFGQLSEEEFKRLQLATEMKSNWYDLICEIKEQPENAMAVSSRDPRDRIISSSSPPVVMVCFLSMANFPFCVVSVCYLQPFVFESGSEQKVKPKSAEEQGTRQLLLLDS